MKNVIISIRMIVVMILLTGIIYPIVVTSIGQLFFNDKANGSMIRINGNKIGSILLSQNFKGEKYFWTRPSAGNYGTVPSGASNLSQTSKTLFENYEKQKNLYGNKENIPSDLLFSSGSGLDPHITPKAALFQVERIIKARNFNKEQVRNLIVLIESNIEHRDFFIFGEERVNVLLLNIALDKLDEKGKTVEK